MWILSRLSNDTKIYLLCDKPKYTVGRNKTCDIIAEPSQSSLGRFHATLHPYDDRVDIVDTESKYGTYVNEQINTNVKLQVNVPHPLKDGDTIRFGFIDFTWKLTKKDIVALTSTLTDQEKESLKADISILGGTILDQWSDTCTHLVVKDLTFTIKVLLSLCHAIPIVKPDYFKALLSSIRRQHPLPNVESFEPLIIERLMDANASLQVNIDRKRLFAGKTFIFMTQRHMEQYKMVIECGMGECTSLEKKKLQRRSLIKPGVIVISNSAASTQSQLTTQAASDLNDFLQSKECRMVPDMEISLAILNCSLEKFCNPRHQLKDNFESSLRIVPSALLADNTPDNGPEVAVAESMISICVPETVEETKSIAVDNNTVIDLDDDDDDVMLAQCLDDTMKSEENRTGKRKNLISSDDEPLSKKLHLDDHQKVASLSKSTEQSTFLKTRQHNTRGSSSRIQSTSTEKSVIDNRLKSSDAIQNKNIAKPPPKRSKTHEESPALIEFQGESSRCLDPPIQVKNIAKPPSKRSKTHESPALIEFQGESSRCLDTHVESQNRQPNNSSQQREFTTQPQRKRIAHRPVSSTFNNDDSDSDEELFKFANQSAKRPKPSNRSDSDSDDNMTYPLSSRTVVPSVPILPSVIATAALSSQSLTQSSQIACDSWLSRPTPSQQSTVTATIRPQPKKRSENVKKPISANISAAWQIGQHYISAQPIRIPTQGWFTKDALKSKSLNFGLKKEIDDEREKSTLEDTKWIDSIRSGIQVITKSLNLITTGGKSFKKQQFIVPTEVISKIYKY